MGWCGNLIRGRRCCRVAVLITTIALILLHGPRLCAAPAAGRLSGQVVDPQGNPVPNAHVSLYRRPGEVIAEMNSDSQGKFRFAGIEPGTYHLSAEAASLNSVGVDVLITEGQETEITLAFKQLAAVMQSVTVLGASTSALTPDASERVVVHDEVLDANPGRPGAPISIPGLPIETASGGIKAPQYFAPGVAGDHGEPIAQYFQIGNFLFPNNLPANAHGNGYADPNFLIAPTIEAVTVDGGAFNVREGNNSVDLSAAYLPRQAMTGFLELTGDYRDIDVVAGWSPRKANGWVALEAAYGNGFLERLEHRQQYKLNGYREFKLGKHDVTLFGAAYYGFSFVPGLIPINTFVANDTVDNRQLDWTHNFMAVATDTWNVSDKQQLTFAGFFREYGLTLRSNFSPDYTQQPYIGGLIQQSESRTVVGGGLLYTRRIRPWISLLAGTDLRRDAPRNVDLKTADAEGAFLLVTSNNLTFSMVEPFAAVDGNLGRYVHLDAGFRQEEVWVNNQDLVNPQNSFDRLASLTLPKVTFTIRPPGSNFLPTAALSYGEAFFVQDPRIGTGTGAPSLLATARAYQLVLDETIKKTELRVTLKHVTNSQQLAKIDPDTGLQENMGPSLIRVLAVSAQRNFSQGSIYISYAQADARDRLTGEPVPEAPRQIWDAVGTMNRLPFHLRARTEFEFVHAKPLGDGFVGVPVYEWRGAVLRPFLDGRMMLGTEFLVASGYTGQTTETFAYPTDPTYPTPIERIVGVPLKSYVTVTWAYHFGR